MQLRPSFIALLTGLWLALAVPSSAQLVDTGGNLQEWGFTEEGTLCPDSAAFSDDNIVWGTGATAGDGLTSCAESAGDDNIVWGTLLAGDDNIVWGTDIEGTDDNIVWGTARDDDNIVWGTRAVEVGEPR